ncbi:pseudaminic acid synthase [Brachybacterium muris]|uniref:pseudaminic acid synthase n=1 Tax=Brachybacterium muris TaxID=219301 RepID=UPI0021A752CC|nr:pseudaminic acid synthase [Brachybacterium muris]MCT1429365.1 pseudaminic acid synthase [Brachybacterium muris]
MRIGNTQVGAGQKPYIIAEMSGNHDGSLDTALAIVDAAADAGADAVKLQTFTADSMTLDIDHPDFVINNPESLWYGRRIYDLYEEAHTPWEWHAPIFKRARERGIHCFSSPFSNDAVDFLVELGAPCLKIASLESVDLGLITYAASSGLPMIISTGLAEASEVQEAIDAARAGGCEDLIILKCTSSYPTDPAQSHLRTIPDMRERFGVDVGLSDHTLGIGVPLAAIAFGAVVVEKHVTLSRDGGGVDAAFSLEPSELATLVEESERAFRAIGSVHYGPTEGEQGAMLRRRSLYFVEDIREGDVVTDKHVRSIRPGKGLAPKHLDEVLGKRAARNVSLGTPVSWELLD